MKVLALDLATVTGFAVGEPCGEPVHGVITLEGSFGAKCSRLRYSLWGLIQEHMPDRVIFEQPLHAIPKGGGKGPTMRLLQGLTAVAEMVCHDQCVRVFEVATSTWRKHFLGHGGLPSAEAKTYCVQLCHDRGWMVVDNNAADACGIWDYACALVSPEHGARAGFLV